jgi:hypothetical protein
MDVVTLGAALNGSKKYTDTVAQSLMGGVRYQGEVDYYADLPNNAKVGDAYTVKYSGTSGTDLDGTEYTWGLNHQTQQYGWIDFSKDSYTKTQTNKLLTTKVDKETGKGLSTNDYTTAEKTKLAKAITTDEITIGSDYLILNGIRVYVSAIEPTGTIPDGSVWIGG